MSEIFNLNQKNILITGSSSGIGKEIAKRCAEMGGRIILTGRNKDKLHETHRLLNSQNHEIFAADLAITEEIDKLVDFCPQMDGIVLNAGLVKTMPLKFMKSSSIAELFSVNIESSIYLINKLVKHKKIKTGGSICFISSVASEKSTIGNSVYSATKGAVNSFTKAIALELSARKIRSNAVLPGYIETNILSDSAVSEQQLDSHKKNYPLGRFGRPDDVSNLVVYLLSDASEWMTGSLLKIDGGFSLK